MTRTDELRDGLTAFQGDMATHQRVTGQPVTGEANRALASGLFAELDAKGQFATPEPEPVAAPAPVEASRDERQVDGRSYTVTKDNAVSGPTVPMTTSERELTVRAMRRLQMLLELQDEGILGAPSWRTRACAIMAMAGNRARFAQELDALLDESDRLFGSWKVDPDRKIIFG